MGSDNTFGETNFNPETKVRLFDVLTEEEIKAVKQTEIRNCTLGQLTIQELIIMSRNSCLKMKHDHDLSRGGVMELIAELLDRNRWAGGTFI